MPRPAVDQPWSVTVHALVYAHITQAVTGSKIIRYFYDRYTQIYADVHAKVYIGVSCPRSRTNLTTFFVDT